MCERSAQGAEVTTATSLHSHSQCEYNPQWLHTHNAASHTQERPPVLPSTLLPSPKIPFSKMVDINGIRDDSILSSNCNKEQ